MQSWRYQPESIANTQMLPTTQQDHNLESDIKPDHYRAILFKMGIKLLSKHCHFSYTHVFIRTSHSRHKFPNWSPCEQTPNEQLLKNGFWAQRFRFTKKTSLYCRLVQWWRRSEWLEKKTPTPRERREYRQKRARGEEAEGSAFRLTRGISKIDSKPLWRAWCTSWKKQRLELSSVAKRAHSDQEEISSKLEVVFKEKIEQKNSLRAKAKPEREGDCSETIR